MGNAGHKDRAKHARKSKTPDTQRTAHKRRHVWTEVDFDRLTASQVGAFYGVGYREVLKWVPLGCPRSEDKTFVGKEVAKWKQDRLQAKVDAAIDQLERSSENDSDGLERKRQAEAEMAEIKLAEIKKQIVAIENVRRYATAIHEAVKNDSRNMVEKVILKLGLDREGAAIVHEHRVRFLEHVVAAVESGAGAE